MAKLAINSEGVFLDGGKVLDFSVVVENDKDIEFSKTVTVDKEIIAKGHKVVIVTENNTDDDDVNYLISSLDNKLSIKNQTDDTVLWETDKDGNVIIKTSATINGNTVWHKGNDGSGSELDADLLDGIESTSFVRSDSDDDITGILTHKAKINIECDKAEVTFRDTTDGTKVLAVKTVGDTLKILNETDDTDIVLFNSNGTVEYKSDVTLDTKATVNGDFTTTSKASIDGADISLPNLPTSDPAVAGQLWNDGGVLKVSAG